MTLLAFVRFEAPGYLALLALIPLLVVFSYRSLAGLGPWRRHVALAARCLVVLVMVLALAGAQRTQRVNDLTVMFLVDRSKSVPNNLQKKAFDFLRRAQDARKTDDRLGVVAFDGVAAIEQLPMKTLEVDRVSDPLQPDQTSLAAATRLALALLPADSAGRIVLLSDGNENVGDVLKEAEQLKFAGVPIDVVPLEYEHGDEVVFEQLKAPANAAEGETVNLQLLIRAQREVAGEILLWHNDALLDLNGAAPGAGFRVTLQPGPNRILRQVPLRTAGAHRFRAQFVPATAEADTLADNNVGRAFTYVSVQGRALIITSTDDEREAQPAADLLKQALEHEKLHADVVVAGAQPLDPVGLLNYSAVVLNNVAAGEFTEAEKQALAVYVRDMGGGLVMIGGDDAFGAGGWMGSPVEEVMPVSFDIKHRKEFLKGALTLVMHACEIPNGNFLGERAAIEAVKALSARDLVGVLAWQWQGNDQKNWVVPLQEVGTKTPIINTIRTMSMGDMPDLDEPMRQAVEALLMRRDVGPKHMIVVSDFDPLEPKQDLIDTMKKNGITCSTVAIGYGGHPIDEKKALWIAQSTGGRFHRTNDHSKIPQIFVKESREVRRSLVQEGEFRPGLANPLSPLVAGLTNSGIPQLRGYVLTTAKPTATIPIVHQSDEGEDPVLAHWQVGLGKAVAFTSGMWPRWGPEWVAWDGFSKFWAQALRWVSRPSEEAAFDVSTTVHGGKAKIRLDALDKNAAALNFMDVGGAVITPELSSQKLQLTQTGPGRYEAEFDARAQGNYILNLAYAVGQGADARHGILRTGVTVPYSPEYGELKANLPLLDELRRRTSGRVLGTADPGAAFDHADLPRAEHRSSLWETLVRWLLVLFLIDVAVRRIAINPIEIYRNIRRFIGELAGRRQTAAEAAAVLTTLKGTRTRVRQEQTGAPAAGVPGQDAARPAATTRYEAHPADSKAVDDLGRALGGATQQDTPVVARPTGKRPAQSEADYTARLLKAKRKAREDMRKDQSDDAPQP